MRVVAVVTTSIHRPAVFIQSKAITPYCRLVYFLPAGSRYGSDLSADLKGPNKDKIRDTDFS